MGVGRKSKYETVILPNLEFIKEQIKAGTSEKDICKALNLGYGTWHLYKKEEKKELVDAICEGVSADIEDLDKEDVKDKNKIVARLRAKLIEKAEGYRVTVKKYMKCKCIEYDPDTGKKWREVEKVVPYDEEIYYPSDTNAIMNALDIYDKSYIKNYAAHQLKVKELKLKEDAAKKEDW